MYGVLYDWSFSRSACNTGDTAGLASNYAASQRSNGNSVCGATMPESRRRWRIGSNGQACLKMLESSIDRDLLDQAALLIHHGTTGAGQSFSWHSSLGDWPALTRLSWSSEPAHQKIGDMPPCPPTLRGRIGALFVRIVRRALFWYSGQIAAFQGLVGGAAVELIETLREHARAIDALTSRQAAQADEATALGDRVGQIGQLLDQTAGELGGNRRELEEIRREISNLKQDFNRLQGGIYKLGDEASGNRSQMGYAVQRLRYSRPSGVSSLSSGFDDRIERILRAHSDAFRGEFSEIKDRLRVYVDRVRSASEATGGAGVLDLGCGRGEWLQLMREAGVPAQGIDSSSEMVSHCQDSGLTAERADLLQFLRDTPDRSLAVLTAFHVLEHLHWKEVVEVMEHTARILLPGGIVIFETPNPQNLQVATYGFYLDPTHVRPLPSELLCFLAEMNGLSEVETILLHPYPESARLEATGPEASLLNHVFFSAQDYSLVAART